MPHFYKVKAKLKKKSKKKEKNKTIQRTKTCHEPMESEKGFIYLRRLLYISDHKRKKKQNRNNKENRTIVIMFNTAVQINSITLKSIAFYFSDFVGLSITL